MPFPSPGDLPDPGIKPAAPAASSALQADSLLLNHWRSPIPNVCYAFKTMNKMDKKNMYRVLILCQALCYVKQPCEIGSDTCPIGQMGKQRQEWVGNFLKVTQLVNGCAGIN